MNVCVPLLPEDFQLVLKNEAGLLGHTVKLGPHGAAHISLGMDDVTVRAAVDTDMKGLGDAQDQPHEAELPESQGAPPRRFSVPPWVLYAHLDPPSIFPWI